MVLKHDEPPLALKLLLVWVLIEVELVRWAYEWVRKMLA